MAAARLNTWLTRMRYWKDGLHPNEAHLLAFQYLGIKDSFHEIRLVDVGLPEGVGEPRRKPAFGPVIRMVQEGSLDFKMFAVYAVMTPKVQDNILILRSPGPFHGCCRIPSGIHDVDPGWIELFCGGMGAWSFACEALGHKVSIAVDKDPLACEGYAKNHGLHPFQGDVADARWVPFEPKEGFLTSPPCPIFSNLTGAGGFDSSDNSGWDDLLFMLRFVLPPLLLLENPTSMHQRLGEVTDFMKLAGYKLRNIQSIQLASYSPMRRDRSISIWVRDNDLDTLQYDNSHPWRPMGYYHTLLSVSCIAPPELCTPELQISEQQQQVLSDPKFGGKSTRAAAWAKQCVYLGQQAPTIQHRYVSNLNMSKDRLVKFGLHCPILVPPGLLPPRFFSPWEVARGLLFPQHVRVPHQAGQAWELLGNSVSPLQCLAGLLTLDIARGRLTREQADESVSRLIISSVTLSQKRVVSRDGWDELVPVDGPLVADWEALQDVNGTPPRTQTSSISTPKDSLPSTPRASDDSRAPKDGSPDRGSQGYDEENPTDSEGPTTDKTRRYPSPRTPEDRPVDTPEKLAQNELFKRISGIRQHPNPSAIPEERLLHGFATGPSSEVHAQIPDTIPWTPILIPSTTQHTQEVRSPFSLHSHSDTAPQRTNQSAFVSLGMSRPIGASSYNHMDVDNDEAEQMIPDPMTPRMW